MGPLTVKLPEEGHGWDFHTLFNRNLSNLELQKPLSRSKQEASGEESCSPRESATTSLNERLRKLNVSQRIYGRCCLPRAFDHSGSA